jgi:hypothetical protein
MSALVKPLRRVIQRQTPAEELHTKLKRAEERLAIAKERAEADYVEDVDDARALYAARTSPVEPEPDPDGGHEEAAPAGTEATSPTV